MKTTISFTTIPNRIDKIKPMVDSLLNQTIRADEIVLWVSDEYKRVGGKIIIPKFIRDSTIRVEYCDDIGPFTKLYYSLDEHWEDKEHIIISVDDDVYYPPTWFENLIKASKYNPNSAIGYRGRILNSNNKTEYNHSRLLEGSPTNNVTKVDLITGTWGALYKPKFFTDEVFNDEITKENFFVDDIWVTGNLAKNNIERLVIKDVGVKPINGLHNIDSLWSINAGSNNNNKILQYFKDYL
tara:strand:- start:1767 stop:2486 length:720 start_codon:yes stop_codon:yes gene_type:complete